MIASADEWRFRDDLVSRLRAHYAGDWPENLTAAVETLLGISRYLDRQEFGCLLEAATQAVNDPDLFRRRNERFQEQLDHHLFRKAGTPYSGLTRMAVRAMGSIETALSSHFANFLRLAETAHHARAAAPEPPPTMSL